MMFDLFPQQNTCDLLKSTAYHWIRRGGTNATLAAIRRLESARIWQPPLLAQAIDQVMPGAISIDEREAVHIAGGPATLEKIVDTYLELTGEAPVREVL